MIDIGKDKKFYKILEQLIKNYPVIIIMVLLFAVFSILYTKQFLSPINMTATLRQFVTLMLFAIGPSIVMILGSMDLSFIGIWMLGSVFLWKLEPVIGPVALLIFPVVGILTGFIIGLIHTKGRMPSFILTLSVLITFYGFTVFLAGGYPRKVDGFGFITARLIPRIPTPFLLAIPVIVVAVFLILKTKIGVYFYAIGSNEEGARLSGIKVEKYKMLAFILSGTFSGVGSMILFQHLGGSVGVEFNLNNTIRPLVAIILGGTPLVGGSGGPQRTILGVITFSILYRGLHLSPIRPELIDLIVGIILIGSIILSSKGKQMKGVLIT